MQLWRIIPGKDGQFEETMIKHGVMALGNDVKSSSPLNKHNDCDEERYNVHDA